jgi:hypothetical protein
MMERISVGRVVNRSISSAGGSDGIGRRWRKGEGESHVAVSWSCGGLWVGLEAGRGMILRSSAKVIPI